MDKLCNNPDTYERILRKTLDKFIPYRVDWEITYRCNLKCYHCYQTGPTQEPELTTQETFSIIDQLASLNCLFITFTGGEILLREDFFDIAQYARKKEFAIHLFTNGTLIDEEVADKIKEINPVTVEISLYGTEPSVHENITGIPGSYRKTMGAFKLLKKRNINTVMKGTIMRRNVGEFDNLKNFAESIGLKFTFSFSVIPKINGSKEVLRNRLDQEQLRDVFRSRDWLVRDIGEGGVQSYKPLCTAGFNSLYISPYGEVFPCVVLRESCGNLKEEPLKEIWQAPVFKKLRDVKFEDLKECLNCNLAGYCDRCAGLAWLETSNLLGPSPNDCTLAGVRKWAVEKRRLKDEKREKKEILHEAKSSL